MPIYINHSSANNVVEDMLRETQQITSLIQQLQTDLNATVQEWFGADKETYTEQVQPAWNRQVSALGQILQSHGDVLSNVSTNYIRTDRSNAEGFSSIPI
ncbi:WXG100 family type VII secretion target [Streptomyces sp. NPDC088387]|uniref:WXG100 family type VII secretion target n=1 Tax=Streptomyces sp. NPDC088387 TaxID=3365859 RepID=UPI00380C98EF